MSHRTTAKSKHRSGTISTDKLVVGALTLTTLVTGGIMSSMHVNADDGNNAVVDDTTIIVPTTCSMSGTINEGDEHTATILPGSYKDNIGKTDIKALCNDYNGFSIYAIGYSNNTSGTPTDGTNTMIGQTTGSTIATGTNDSGDTSNWAMKLTKISDTTITYNPNNLSISGGYNSYNVIPSTLTKVVEYKDTNTNNSSSTDQTKGAHIETTYAAYIASTQPADTYNGKVKYLLVHPANFTTGTYSIAYNANGGTGTMEETNIPNYEPHTLAASTLTAPAGYMLAGWCDTQDNTASGVVQGADPQTTCAGTAYQDGGTIPASIVASGSTLTLYAYWEVAPTIGDLTFMQDFASLSSKKKAAVLSSMNTGAEYQLTDSRDTKEYYIAKLADGNIWMTQNLDLDIEAGRTYTSADTDLVNSTIGTSWTPTVSTSTTSSWTDSTAAPSSYDPGNLYWNGTIDISGGTLSNRTTTDPSVTSGGTHYHVGNYYNWTAAVAMSDSSSYTTGLQDVNQSICPAGWRLPTYSGDKSYYSLKNAQGLTVGTSGNIQNAPTYFVYGGFWLGSSYGVGYDGYYWSSVVRSSSYSYQLDFNAYGGLYPQNNDYRNIGNSLRCVAR